MNQRPPTDDSRERPGAGFVPAIVLTASEPGLPLAAAVDSLARLAAPLVVVGDGSCEAAGTPAQETADAGAAPRSIIYRRAGAPGQAAALRTGFAAAAGLGATHVLALDAGVAFDPADVPRLLDAARDQPLALVLATRRTPIDGPMPRSRMGRWLAELIVRVECGVRVRETAFPVRVYPLELVRTVRCFGGRFAFEAEVVTRAVWGGYPVVETPVGQVQRPRGGRPSRTRTFGDGLLRAGVHLLLILRALAPWPHRRHVPGPASSRSFLRRLGDWLNPVRCWREARAGDLGRLELAAALGLGVWIGTVPFYGAQTAMCLYVAWRLHLHPAAVVMGSQVSLPPIGFVLAGASVWVGHLLLTGRVLRAGDVSFEWSLAPSLATHWFPAWTLGGVIVGFGVGLGVFAAVLLLGRRAPAAPALTQTR